MNPLHLQIRAKRLINQLLIQQLTTPTKTKMSAQDQTHAPALGIVKPKGVPDIAEEKLAEIAETVEKDYNYQKKTFAEAIKEQIDQNAEEYKKQKDLEPEVVRDIKAVMPEEKIAFSSTGLPEVREEKIILFAKAKLLRLKLINSDVNRLANPSLLAVLSLARSLSKRNT